MVRELVSRQFQESLGVLVKAFSKLLDHSVQFVRIVTGDGLGDQIFDAVLKASPGHGGYIVENTAIADRGTSSEAPQGSYQRRRPEMKLGLRSCFS